MRQVTAGQIASALVAACAEFRVDAASVFERGLSRARPARQLAGAALKAVTGIPARTLAPMLHLAGPELSPSLLAKAGVTTDMMLNVVEAMGGPGLAADLSQSEPPATSPAADQRDAVKVIRSTPVKTTAPDPSRGKPDAAKPDAAAGVQGASATAKAIVRAPAVRRGGGGWKARSKKPAPKPEPPRAVTRLKPVSASVARWAGQFVMADWDVEEVADLFDVHPDALADALEFGAAA